VTLAGDVRVASPVAELAPTTRDAARTWPAWLLPLLIGAVTFAAGALIVEAYVVGVAHDDGMYVILAKSLATGRGYRWLNIPGAPPATHFPPGYPAVLALLWWIFPEFPGNLAAFELANALFMAIAAVGVYHFVRSRFGFSDMGSAILSLVTTLGIPTLTLSVLVMSEPLFLALLIPILLYAERSIESEQPRIRSLFVLALLGGLATLVRTHGIALLGAIGIALMLRRRFRDAALFACVAIATLLPWQLWVSTHAGFVPATMRGNYESYGGWLANGLRVEGLDLVGRTLLRTTGDLAGMFGVLVAPSLPSAARLIGLAIVLSLGAVGVRALWRRAPVTVLFLALYSAIVILWPFWPTRFIWGVWPLVVLLPVLGAREALEWRAERVHARAMRVVALVCSVAVACGYLVYNVEGYRHRWWGSIPRKISEEVRPLLIWVATRTPRNAVLATEAETSVYLYTGRPAVPVGTFTVDEFFVPRTSAENAAVIDTVITHYRPMAVAVSSGPMRDAVRQLAFSQPPKLVAVDTFPRGGLVLVPRFR
jgi:hypothetical protein